MTRTLTAVLSCLALTSTAALHADSIPYQNPGHAAPLMTLTASATGPIMGYFVNQSAGDTDKIALLDVTTGVESSYFFANHSSTAGDTANFGTVSAGDQLVFLLDDSTTNTVLRSDANNADGDAHAYMTAFSGGVLSGYNFPAGTYVGFEDRLVSQKSDLDYNDDNFIFTNVAAQTVTPEPESLVLLGTGALGALGAIRRRLVRS